MCDRMDVYCMADRSKENHFKQGIPMKYTLHQNMCMKRTTHLRFLGVPRRAIQRRLDQGRDGDARRHARNP